MSGIEKLESDDAQILYILDLGLKKSLYENFINIAKVSLEKSKAFWRYQNFSSEEEDVRVLSPPVMDEVLREERQVMKWVRIFQLGTF